MTNITIYAPNKPPAIRSVCRILSEQFSISERPAKDVTHLLLPIPSFEADGRIRGGGVLENILADIGDNVTVIGGNLQHPALLGYPCIDLLQDSAYVAANAALTADCAIRVAGQHLQECFEGCKILIIGWGRIGKCLAPKLKALGAEVGIVTRKIDERHILRALGYQAESASQITLPYKVVINTAPAPVLTQVAFPKDTLKIELASNNGLSGEDVIIARGLPGKWVPESAGKLMAQRITQILDERRN